MLLRTTRMAAVMMMNDARGREPKDDVEDESEIVVAV